MYTIKISENSETMICISLARRALEYESLFNNSAERNDLNSMDFWKKKYMICRNAIKEVKKYKDEERAEEYIQAFKR